MARVFVTRKIPFWEEVGKPLTEAGHEVVVYEHNKAITRGELAEKLKEGYDALLCLLTEKIDAELLTSDVSGRLKVIANYAVGFDNIDVPACQAKNILVTHTPSDAVNESVAEFAIVLMLALLRRVGEGAEYMRNAAYQGWEPEIFMGRDGKGLTLGVIGTGRIGSLVVKRAEGLGLKTIGYSRSLGVSLEEVLAQCDVISLHVPLTAETRHLINKKTLTAVKKRAVLINTARGPVVDEAEVAEALRAGSLGGYGADVFENEPSPYAELLQMENVVLTPHMASATVAARKSMGEIAIKNIVEALAGKVPPNLVKVS